MASFLESISYADKYNIELWDGHKLSQIHLSMLVGRYSPSKNYNEISLEAALPISHTFQEVSNIFLENSSFVKVSGLVLFRPYYLFEYNVDSKNRQFLYDHILYSINFVNIIYSSEETDKIDTDNNNLEDDEDKDGSDNGEDTMFIISKIVI